MIFSPVLKHFRQHDRSVYELLCADEQGKLHDAAAASYSRTI